MGAPNSVSLPREVKPGEVVDLSVTLRAPAQPGRHRSTWKLANAAGKVFDFEQYAEIQVPRVVSPAGLFNNRTGSKLEREGEPRGGE
jgi:hypothetical protein